MKKRTIIEIILAIILVGIGWTIGNKWQITENKLELTFNIVDVFSLIVTITMGIYIAWFLEKEVQDRRIEKDMYLSRISVIEGILDDIDNKFQTNNGSELDYKVIVNQVHRIRTKKNRIFNHVINSSHGKIKSELEKYDNLLKVDIKELKDYLTNTNIVESDSKDIVIKKDKASYSKERTNLIISSLNNIDNRLLDIKVLINKM